MNIQVSDFDGDYITFYNELFVNIDADSVFGDKVSDIFDYRDKDYFAKKQIIEYVSNSEYIIRCALKYDEIIENKIIQQCHDIRKDNCLPKRHTEFFFLKYKRKI